MNDRNPSQQMVATLIFEMQMAQLQVSANQLGAFLKMTDEADGILRAQAVLVDELGKLKRRWAAQIQIVQGAIPTKAIDGVVIRP